MLTISVGQFQATAIDAASGWKPMPRTGGEPGAIHARWSPQRLQPVSGSAALAHPVGRPPYGIIQPLPRPIMEAERLNAIAARLADLKSRELELRRYL